jgi:hypothetical protein
MQNSISIRNAILVGAVALMGSLFLLSNNAFAAGIPVSTAPGQNKLQCFDGTTDDGFGGTCTVSNGAKGPATLNNTDTNAAGDYAGVYILNSTLFGQLLTDVKQLSYNYTGTTTPGPGDLSLNLPIDTNGDGTTDAYAFIDAAYCPGVNGYVDVINDPNCGIYYNGSVFYANWAAFIAAYPGAKVATDSYAFVIAERTPSEASAYWTVSNVKLGKAGK